MPHALHPQRLLAAVVALAVVVGMVIVVADEAKAAPPPDVIDWSDETCNAGFAMTSYTVDGKGKWATVEIEISTSGAPFVPHFALKRVEKGVADPLATTDTNTPAQFRVRTIKKNGTPTSDWSMSPVLTCP